MRKKNIEDKKIVNILSNQKGMALLTTLIFVFILVTFAVALLTMTSNDSKLSTLQRESTRAFYLADAGIEKAVWYLNFSSDNLEGLSWRGTLHEEGENSTEYFNTRFVMPDEVDEDGSTIATLVSTGIVDDGSQFSKGTRKIEVRLIKGVVTSPGMTYNHAILTDGDMTLNGGISISGNIHANGFLTNNGIIDFATGGEATAEVGTNDSVFCTVNNINVTLPKIDFGYFRLQVINPADPDSENSVPPTGKYYGTDTSVEFNNPDELVGIHYVDGDVTIKTDLKLTNATIFATGTITVLGNGDVTLGNEIEDHPLALIAKGNITIGGSVHGEGIIQSTEGSFTSNGVVDINEGVVYAKEGIFNGGGGAEFNVKYPTALSQIPIPGIGVEAWKKSPGKRYIKYFLKYFSKKEGFLKSYGEYIKQYRVLSLGEDEGLNCRLAYSNSG